MKSYLLLVFAILSEVIGTTSLKLSEGFTRPFPSVLVVVGYALSFYLLGQSLKQIPLGTAYALWSGLGTVGAVLAGVLIWHERLNAMRMLGIALIIGGVVVLQLFTQQSEVPPV
jgi:small multidrug resistance pump